MKRLVGILFASTLILGACSQDDTKEDENKKSESTTEKKADDKKDKKTKEDKKSKEEKKSQENEDKKSTQEDNSTEEQNTQENATNEQQPTAQEQSSTQKQTNQSQYSDEYLANNPVSTDGQLTPEEQQRYDEGMKETERLEQKNQEMSDPTYDPNNPYMNMPNQEWRNNTGGGLSSGEMQTRDAILNGTYEGDDAQQVLDAINYYEEKYSK